NGLTLPAVFVNIGGISNITYVPAEGDPIAFDTGPGNMLIDLWVQERAGLAFDRDGAVGAGGKVDEAVVANYLGLPFFERVPPKSLDRADLTAHRPADLSVADGARTFAAVAGRAIVKALDDLPEPAASWIICGGGRHTPRIMKDLRDLTRQHGGKV